MKRKGHNPAEWQVVSILEYLTDRPATQDELSKQLQLDRAKVFEMIIDLERKKAIRWNPVLRKYEVRSAA